MRPSVPKIAQLQLRLIRISSLGDNNGDMMKRHACLALLASLFAATSAQADEAYFGYTYGTETLPRGETELEFWATDRRGKDDGHYDAQDYRLELEHGFSNRFSISGYANFASHHVRGLEPGFEHTDRDFAFQGASAEFKYNILSPYKDELGLTLYAEPGWSRIHSVEGEKGTEWELELKLLLQKNFLDDRLVWATNLTFEPEWEKEVEEEDSGSLDAEEEWEKELKLELSTGLSYQLAPGWFAGIEGRYSSVYPDWADGLHRETYAVFAGPTIHYAARRFWVTATFQPQLFGGPSATGGDLALDEFEKREFRVKIGVNF